MSFERQGRVNCDTKKASRLLIPFVLMMILILGPALILAPTFADALKTPTAPNIDGIITSGEWDLAEIEFDTGPRPCEPPNPGGWDLSGARGRFLWDDTNVYGLIEAYPNTCGAGANPNGPFDQMNWEVYINALGWPAAVYLDTTSLDNNHPGSTVVFSADRMVIEFSVPIATIIDDTGGNLPNPYTFDPNGGDFLEYRLRTTDPDSAGGFDTRDQTLGWVVEPPETSGGYRRLDFSEPPPSPTPPSAPYGYVGGELFNANKLAVLAPYLALIGLIGVVSTVYVLARRREV